MEMWNGYSDIIIPFSDINRTIASMTKDQIIAIANSSGFNVTSNMCKKEIAIWLVAQDLNLTFENEYR